MGGVVNVITPLPGQVGGYNKVKRPENITGDDRRYKKQAYPVSWLQQQPGKYDGADRTRSTKAAVVVIIFMFEISGQQAYKKGQHIHQQVKYFSLFFKQVYETFFYKGPEQEQGKHIKQQVRPVGMYQAATEKPVPLVALAYCRRVKDKIVNDFLVTKSPHRNQGCDNDDDQCDC